MKFIHIKLHEVNIQLFDTLQFYYFTDIMYKKMVYQRNKLFVN